MTDIYSKEKRKILMSNIHSTNTEPEIIIRKALFSEGFRYRINDKAILGKPDILLKKYNTVIFIHGCFWHQHTCKKASLPKTNKKFWKEKLHYNKIRDKKIVTQLMNDGWRVLIIWECAYIKNKTKNKPFISESLLKQIISFIQSDKLTMNIEE